MPRSGVPNFVLHAAFAVGIVECRRLQLFRLVADILVEYH